MARTVRDANLETRTARAKMKQRGRPYFRLIEHGRHLGYRKTREGGSWIARMYMGDGDYRTARIGTADDTLDADGAAILTFAQAQDKAREWFGGLAADKAPKPFTVRQAVEAYLKWHGAESHSAKSVAATTYTANAHILPGLGDVLVAELTTDRIEEWRRGLSEAPARLRTKKTATTSARGRPRRTASSPCCARR